MRVLRSKIALVMVLAASLQACRQDDAVSPVGDASALKSTDGPTARMQTENMLFGNPSNATASVTGPANFLMTKLQYAMSYHRDNGKPNWVSWHLDPTWLGGTDRQNNFRPDPALPSGWYQVGGTSYSGSGFDRGHNCPSADRTKNVTDNGATFLMDNMMPQAPNNNQQTWANLENYARTLVSRGNECYIVAGSYGQGGTGSNGFANTIDNGRIVVPARTWKAIIVLPQGSNDLNRVNATTRVIAVDMPNSNTINAAWGTYRVSVDAIEAATGYNLFSALPAATQATFEARIDSGATQ